MKLSRRYFNSIIISVVGLVLLALKRSTTSYPVLGEGEGLAQRQHNSVNLSQNDVVQNITPTPATSLDTNVTGMVDIAAQNTTEKKYLLLYSHDGFSNQYYGLAGAMALAAQMERTLVLPPILPHRLNREDKDLRYHLTKGRRGSNKGCVDSFGQIKGDIKLVAKGSNYAAWSELYDFDSCAPEFHGIKNYTFGGRRASVSFIEFGDFVQDVVPNRMSMDVIDKTDLLCNNSALPLRIKSKAQLAKYDSASEIAYIGSTYKFGSPIVNETGLPKPSQKILQLLQRIMPSGEKKSLLPRDYVGLHIRVQDKRRAQIDANTSYCPSHEFREIFNSRRRDSEEQLLKHFNDGTVFFLGKSTNGIRECIISLVTSKEEEHRGELGKEIDKETMLVIEKRYTHQIIMLDDLLAHDEITTDLIKNMQVETSTAMLAFDQLIVGLASDVLMVNMMQEFDSTFQGMVEIIHKDNYRDGVLSQLEQNGDDAIQFKKPLIREIERKKNIENDAKLPRRKAHAWQSVSNTSGCEGGVLITSQGGVGSTAFLDKLYEIANGTSNFYINDSVDRDKFKHRPATSWREHNATSIIGHIGKTPPLFHVRDKYPCFHKALVIVGDPLHSIESTHRRFNVAHINKLRRWSKLGKYKRGTKLEEIYNDIAESGKDTTGITEYIQSWYNASQDKANWPEIKVVTAPVLYDNAVEHARWIGVNGSDLQQFSDLAFDTTIRKTHNSSGIPDDVISKVEQVFTGITEIISRIEAEAIK